MRPTTTSTFLFHPDTPRGERFDLTAELAQKLEAEGWVDSPAKLKAQPGKAEPRETPVVVTQGSGRVLSDNIVTPPPERRINKLFDQDGDPVHADLSDDDLTSLIDDMGREELVEALTFAGDWNDQEVASDTLRRMLVNLLRPGLMEAQAGFEVGDPDGAADAGEPQFSTGFETGDSKPSGATATQPEAEMTAAGANRSEDIAPKALSAMSKAEQKRWVEGATAEDVRFQLSARDIAFKARDNKATLQAALLGALNAEK